VKTSAAMTWFRKPRTGGGGGELVNMPARTRLKEAIREIDQQYDFILTIARQRSTY
jgi:hypothetical protein